MVFEPEAAPKDHESFLAWVGKLTKWDEGRSYGDPSVTSTRLRGWFSDIKTAFPPLSGVVAEDDLPEDEASAADYSIGRQFIYICFDWSKSAEAYQAVVELVGRHGLGFFNVSSNDEEVWLPANGRLELGHQKLQPNVFERLSRLFRPR